MMNVCDGHTGRVTSGFRFGHATLEMPSKHPNRYVEWDPGILFLELMGDLRPELQMSFKAKELDEVTMEGRVGSSEKRSRAQVLKAQ